MPPSHEIDKPDLAFLDAHPFVRQTAVDKIYGCIIGSALGDTIGLYTEFMTKKQSEHCYKERKFQLVEPATEFYTDGHRSRFSERAWTDDTDQALLVILSYIHNYTNIIPSVSTDNNPTACANDVLGSDFAARLRIWVEQGLLALDRFPCGIGALVGSVVTNSTFLDNPADCATERWIKTQRHAAPNGSLMRTHPIGVIGIGMSEEKTWELSAEVGRTTHVDPRCVLSCCIEVAIIRGLLRGEIADEEAVNACIDRSYEWVKSKPELMNPGGDAELTEWSISRHLNRSELDRHIYAESFDDLKLDNHKEMGYVYKCLGSAIYLLRLAMRKVSDTANPLALNTLFEDLTVDLIMEGGDAGTNGAAACALLGAYLGYANIPSRWTLGLAHKEWLVLKTHRLAVASGAIAGSLEPEADEATDGGKGLRSRDELEKKSAVFLEQMITRIEESKARRLKESEKDKKKGFGAWFGK
ncbi:ADP-ribosylglycohydrolase-domain-containing protein [Phaeosphaeriaceae sp. PMI808]|nr:ADP-ribosylglycohydrolase-domain-containing protein [Phaeosphaeriaceae sp. PMI808]